METTKKLYIIKRNLNLKKATKCTWKIMKEMIGETKQ